MTSVVEKDILENLLKDSNEEFYFTKLKVLQIRFGLKINDQEKIIHVVLLSNNNPKF